MRGLHATFSSCHGVAPSLEHGKQEMYLSASSNKGNKGSIPPFLKLQDCKVVLDCIVWHMSLQRGARNVSQNKGSHAMCSTSLQQHQ